MHDYKHRITRKYCKYRKKHGLILAFILILRYTLRDLVTGVLTLIIKAIAKKESRFKNGKVLFVEPFQQGFGDLIFQTPLFESLNSKGYSLHILISRHHLPIIEDNPFVSKIIVRDSIKNLFLILCSKYEAVFVLSRDTIPETMIALIKFRSKVVLMDSNLKFWNKIFKSNHTLAWQKIFKEYFDKSLIFGRPMIYSKFKKPNSSEKRIGIIAGVDKKEKSFDKIRILIRAVTKLDFGVELFGKDSDWIEMEDVKDYVNKITYKETVEKISRCNLIIGTESSLVHVSTTLRIPTLIIENQKRPFGNYSVLDKEEYVYKIDEDSSLEEIIKKIKSIQIVL